MRAPLVLLALALAPSAARAERPADVLARLRGAPSTHAGALGSAFPKQYVDAYRCARPPIIVYPGLRPVSTVSVTLGAGPVTLGGTITTVEPTQAVVACPAPGWPTTTTVTTTTTTVTTTTAGGPAAACGGARVLAPALVRTPAP